MRCAQVLAVAHAREYEIEVVPILAREEFRLGDLRPLLAQCLDDNRRQGDLRSGRLRLDVVNLAPLIKILFNRI